MCEADAESDAFTLSVESVMVNRLMGAVWLVSVEEPLTQLPYPDGGNFDVDRPAPDAALGTVLWAQEVLPIVPEIVIGEANNGVSFSSAKIDKHNVNLSLN